jgi:seryl-tRNA synthetase
MIAIELLREQPELIKAVCQARAMDLDVDALVALDQEYRTLLQQCEQMRQRRNQIKKERNHPEAKTIKQDLATAEERLKVVTTARKNGLDMVPNLLAPDTPIGDDDAANVAVAHWGQVPEFDFTVKSHVELAESLQLMDFERGAKAAGRGFYYLMNDGVRLANALYAFTEQFLVDQGFAPMRTPIMTKTQMLFNTGFLPFFADQIYSVQDTDLALIGTSEQSLLAFKAKEIVLADELPLRYCAFTPCFRTEAGAAGRASKGAFRVHQFYKCEQIVLCRPEESEHWHRVCQHNAESLMQALEIPHRVVRVAAGDMGAPGYKKYDIEGWFAGFGEYRETHSNTNLLDYQSRRLQCRFKDASGRMVHPHTISATAMTDRALVALLENNQTADGTIKIPAVLQPYMGGQVAIKAPERGAATAAAVLSHDEAVDYRSVGQQFPAIAGMADPTTKS